MFGLTSAVLLVGIGFVAVPPPTDASGPSGPTTDAYADAAQVRPGARLWPTCTIGPLFVGNGTLYGSTAGHCVGNWEGEEVRLYDSEDPFGEVVAYRYERGYLEDWALIRIYDNVSATTTVRHWTGPTQPTNLAQADRDDIVCHYGWGGIYRPSDTTRHRCGQLAYTERGRNVTAYTFRGRVASGDSGSPVIHYATGQPVGIVTRGKNTYDASGPDICSLLDRFAEHGYNLSVATAPYDPPPADPTVPAPTVHPMRVTHAEPTDCFGSGLGGGLIGETEVGGPRGDKP